MVEAIRIAEKSLGGVSYELSEGEAASRVFRRSLFVVVNVKAGEVLTEKNVRVIRPGYGLAPKLLPQILGKKFRADAQAGTPLSLQLLEP